MMGILPLHRMEGTLIIMKVSEWKWEFKRCLAQKTQALVICVSVLLSLALCVILTKVEAYDVYAQIAEAYFDRDPEDREIFLESLENIANGYFPDDTAQSIALKSLIPGNTKEFISFSKSVRRFSADKSAAETYPEYLEKSLAQSRKMRILSKKMGRPESTDARFQKVYQDYSALKDVIPIFDRNAGVNFCLDMPGYILLAIFVPVFLGLCEYEREKSWIGLYKTMPGGQGKMIIARLVMTTLWTLLFSVLTQAVYFLWAFCRLGCGDLTRPVQSVYTQCVIPCSVAGMITLSIIFRFFGSCLISYITVLMTLLIPQTTLSVFLTLCFPAAGWLLKQMISSSNLVLLLKRTSLTALLQPTDILCETEYVSLSGNTVRAGTVALTWAGICAILLWLACLSRFNKIGSTGPQQKRFQNRQRLRATARLWPHERYAFWIGRKGWVLFLVFLLTLSAARMLMKPEMTLRDKYLYFYIEEARQQEDPGAWLEKKLDESQSRESPNPNERQALSDAVEQYQRLNAKNLDKEAFIFEEGYRYLFADRSGILYRSILSLLMLILSASLFQEHKLQRLINTYPSKDASYRRYKKRFCRMIAVMVTLPVQGMFLFFTFNTYPMIPGITMNTLSFMPSWIRIHAVAFLLLILILRLMIALLICRLCISKASHIHSSR